MAGCKLFFPSARSPTMAAPLFLYSIHNAYINGCRW